VIRRPREKVARLLLNFNPATKISANCDTPPEGVQFCETKYKRWFGTLFFRSVFLHISKVNQVKEVKSKQKCVYFRSFCLSVDPPPHLYVWLCSFLLPLIFPSTRLGQRTPIASVLRFSYLTQRSLFLTIVMLILLT